MKRLNLVTTDAQLAAKLRGQLADLADLHQVAADDTRALMAEDDATDLAMVDMQGTTASEDLARIVYLLRRNRPNLPVLMLGVRDDAALAAIRAGATDFLLRGAAPEEMRERVQLYVGRASANEPGAQAAMIVVIAGQTNTGENAIAINQAVLRAKTGQRVLLVDLAMPFSEAGTALNLKLRYAIGDAIADLPRLDTMLIRSALPAHEESGLRVLSLANEETDLHGIAPGDILDLMEKLRGSFDEIVVNVGAVRSGAILPQLMGTATVIHLVALQTLTSIRACRDILAPMRHDATLADRAVVLVADYRDEILLTDRQVLDALELKTVVRIPAAQAVLANALNNGKPVTLDLPGSPYARAIAGLCGGQRGPEAARRRGRFSFGRLPSLAMHTPRTV